MAQRRACTLTFRLYTAILYSINRVVKNISESLPALRSTKVLDQLRERIRYLHYSIRTEQAYVYWVRAYIRFHGIRHPATMAGPEVEQFLGWLVSARNVSASTHRQALSALLFLYDKVLGVNLPWLAQIGRPCVSKHLAVVLFTDEVARIFTLLAREHRLSGVRRFPFAEVDPAFQ